MRTALLASTALVACAGAAAAADATWNLNGTGNFNTPANWTPATVPNATGTAFFGVSNQNVVGLLSGATQVGGWTFNAGASTYTFNNTRVLTFHGAGIVINGGSAAISNTFLLNFNGNSTAGSAAITNTRNLNFHDNSTAGFATITNNFGGILQFETTSTAGNANISNSSILSFFNASTAGSAIITNNVAGSFNFNDNSSAANANIVNNGPLNFNGNSTAGSANIANNLNLNFNDNSTAGSATITNIATLNFNSASTAGNATINNTSGGASGGTLSFNDTTTAGDATIANSRIVDFFDSSTAGSATITSSGSLTFRNNSTAGDATITNSDSLFFRNNSTAGNATITNSAGASAVFIDNSTGGNAAIINSVGATTDFSPSIGPAGDNKLTVGSIAGAGLFQLGANELTVGSNNFSTNVSGVIAGSGSLVKVGTGTLTLSGTNTYSGGTTFIGGTVSVGADANLGAAAGALTFNGGTLQITGTTYNSTARTINWGTAGGGFDIADAANAFTVNQALTGTGSLSKSGAGTLILTGANSYIGGTTISAGTLQLGNGGTSGSIAGDIVNNGILAINRSDTFTVGNMISGSGGFVQAGAGTTILSGHNGYTGPTTVAAGTLRVSGSIAGSSGVTVNAGATLGGTGIVTGSVASTTINTGGTLSPGDNAVGDLSVEGNLLFQTGAFYAVQVSPTNASSTFVTGSTTVAGTLTANDLGGTYSVNRIFPVISSTGPLTGTFSTFTPIGSFSGANLSLTYGAREVFLVITATPAGPPVWSMTPGNSDWNTGSNWVGGTVPTATDIAEFNTSTITTINIQQANTQVGSLQFNAGAPAYTFNITGTAGVPASLVILGDGIADISGNAPTFVVSGVSGALGTLQFSNSSAAGDAVIVTNAFGQAIFSGNSAGDRARFISNAGGVVDFSGTSGTDGNNRITVGSIEGSGTYNLGSNLLVTGINGLSTIVSGTINDGGLSGGTGASLVKVGGGTLILSGANTYTGLTAVLEGTLQLGNGGTSGSILGNVITHAVFAINRSDTYAFGGLIVGDGSFVQMGPGTTILTANNAYFGGTTISAGTLQLGNGGTSGSIVGDVVNNGTLAVNRTDTLTLSGVISGTGAFQQNGTGTTIFTADNTYGGGTTINAGTLQLGNGGTSGSIAGDVVDNGTFSINRSDTYTFGGVISGTGSFAQIGPGTTVLTAANTYFGGTAINGGVLAVAADANLGAATGGIAFDGGTLQFLSGFATNRTVALNAGGGTFDTNGNIATLAGAVGGPGGLTKVGAGTLVLSGANTYSGGTILQQGTLQLANDSALGTGALTTLGSVVAYAPGVTIANPIVLNSNDTQLEVGFGAATQAGAISETGGARPLEKIGSGTLIFTGNNSYTGGTTISAGTLQLGTPGTQGALAGAVTVAALPAALSIVNADVSGIKSILNNGLVEFSTGTTAGSIAITNNRTLDFSGNASAGNANITTGVGSLTRFFDTSTAGNATIENVGFIQFTETATGGAAQIANNDSIAFFDSSTAGTATFANTGSLQFQASSSAESAIINNTGGEVSFSGTSTAANAIITNAVGGSIAFFDTASGGNASITNNGILSISGLTSAGTTVASIGGSGDIFLGEKKLTFGSLNTNTEISGVIFGDGGSLTKVGTGTTILSGDNEYTGGTTINGGVLQLGSGGATGSILGDAINNATLAFNRSNAYQFDGVISGSGAVNQIGAGVTTLTANHSYTGTTTVLAGGLVVNGSIASSSSLTVNNNSFVGGTGILPSTTIAGGTLSPGNSIGTITVQGNLVMTAASTYRVEVSPTAADRTNVTGTATVGGTVQALFQPGTYLGKRYTILSAAGGSSGTFANLTTGNLPAGFEASLSYNSTDVLLDLVATLGAISGSGLNVNQQNVANALNNFFNTGGTLPPGFVSVFGLTGPALGNALTQLSGEVATGAALSATQMMNAFLSMTLNPYGGSPTGNPGALGYARALGANEAALPKAAADAYAANMPVKAAPPATIPGEAWSVWGQGYGGHNKTDGNLVVGSHDTTARTYGFAAGTDYRVSPATTVGFALAGGELNWNLSQGLGSGKSDVFQAGVYGSHRIGAAYVSAALAYAWYDMSTDRTVTAVGNDVLRASFDAHNIGGRLEGGYRFAMSSWGGVTPYGAVQVQRFRTPNYSEVAGFGNNTFALSYNSNSTTASRFELGSWFDHLFALNHGNAIMLRGRLAWAHDDGNNGAISSVFQTLLGAGFTVNGATPPKNLALASVGAELRLVNNVSLGARFDGEFSDRAQTYSGTGTVRYRW